MIYALAFFIGVIAGLRAMTAPAAVSWAASLGILGLDGSWLAFLGNQYVAWALTALAVAELVTDQLPTTPSRKVPVQFGTRLVMGGLCGAALALPAGLWIPGLVLGMLGAFVGTIGGAEVRARMALAFGRDLPAALIEDAVAILGAVAIVAALR